MPINIRDISPIEIGERLRVSRESSGITQEKAARSIGVARTTLIAIEQGRRRARLDEIQQLAGVYGLNVNSVLRNEAVHVDLIPRFRKLHGGNVSTNQQAVRLLSSLARAEVELENLLGIQRDTAPLPERRILPGDVRTQAEANAAELRQHLGIGMGPIPDVATLLEIELGVRIYTRKLDANISGLFAWEDSLGPCILLNAIHPPSRRNQTIGHECGHLMSTRQQPEVLHSDDTPNSREERYAAAFGRAFLTPSRSVMHKFREITAGASQLTRRHVIMLSHFFRVSREAITRRLEELELVKKGTWDWFQENGGITNKQERQVLGDRADESVNVSDSDSTTSLRLNLLAAEVYKRRLLSEGQLANLLRIDRIELRGLFDGLEIEEGEVDGINNLLD
jgi:Zn-dependent peptidase ImmA (M78 family)/transcriptional regulator with XRE-family HTH domain